MGKFRCLGERSPFLTMPVGDGLLCNNYTLQEHLLWARSLSEVTSRSVTGGRFIPTTNQHTEIRQDPRVCLKRFTLDSKMEERPELPSWPLALLLSQSPLTRSWSTQPLPSSEGKTGLWLSLLL